MKISYILAFMLSIALLSCGNEHTANETQEESKPNPGAQVDAKMTNPNTSGRLSGEGEAGGENVDLSMTDPSVGGNEMMPSQMILENITSNQKLSTLAAALRKAGMVNTLNDTGPYTVFAPQNKAFEALPATVLDELMKTENKQRLQSILKNHVVTGKLTAADLKDGAILNTVGGEQLKVAKQGEKVMINGAEVVRPDALSENGVIHVIDKVLVTEQ
ncbi:fasciclin domain-containing protein [Pontibacter oryzae]|uniref:Fasciclin domain-containing protein n=1 Tax=Pontibacter oryzae TaxID=2304593 RepID=A0A399S3D5_9BACT|nr:fasciclin domain-containing protein [Pontibacter oryzae]RIJ37033.1 fasciclin domain-containing protein [Pontibacter oryzae]